jgi:hypothetical protein
VISSNEINGENAPRIEGRLRPEQRSMTVHRCHFKPAGDIRRIRRCLLMTNRLESLKESIEVIVSL